MKYLSLALIVMSVSAVPLFGMIMAAKWSPVNKIDNLNRDFFVLCHD